MFDIGFPELLLVAVVVLLVLGPERLPEALRAAGLWIGRLQRSFNSVKTEIEREIGMDEIRRQLHNESVMAEMRKLEQDLKANADPRLNGSLKDTSDAGLDSNNILPEDSLGLAGETDSSSQEQTEPGPQAPASSLADQADAALDKLVSSSDEAVSEAATVEQLQREAGQASGADADTGATNRVSEGDHEQRA